MKFFLIENDILTASGLEVQLCCLGQEVCVYSGAAASAAQASAILANQPDYIIIGAGDQHPSLMMKNLQNHEEIRRLPVFVLLEEDEPAFLAHHARSGADYVLKKIENDFSALAQKILKIINNREKITSRQANSRLWP